MIIGLSVLNPQVLLVNVRFVSQNSYLYIIYDYPLVSSCQAI